VLKREKTIGCASWDEVVNERRGWPGEGNSFMSVVGPTLEIENNHGRPSKEFISCPSSYKRDLFYVQHGFDFFFFIHVAGPKELADKQRKSGKGGAAGGFHHLVSAWKTEIISTPTASLLNRHGKSVATERKTGGYNVMEEPIFAGKV
jgi:hypothetical protein